MRAKGRENQTKGAETKIQVSATYESDVVDRIEALAKEQGKSRSLIMAELIEAGLPILKARQRAVMAKEEAER